MRTRLIGIPLAGLLLVGGATAVLAQSGAASAVAEAATGAGSLLGDVLSDLVDDGVINQDQADKISDAVDARRTELREQARARREQMRTFLEDGVLSADELAQLPEDHPLRNLDEFLDDGQLTTDELRQLRGLRGPGFGFGHRFHGGPPPMDGSDDGANDGTDVPAEGSSFSID